MHNLDIWAIFWKCAQVKTTPLKSTGVKDLVYYIETKPVQSSNHLLFLAPPSPHLIFKTFRRLCMCSLTLWRRPRVCSLLFNSALQSNLDCGISTGQNTKNNILNTKPNQMTESDLKKFKAFWAWPSELKLLLCEC